MAEDRGPIGPRVEWKLTHKRTGQERTFTQTELSIMGEARLLSWARHVGNLLKEKEFDWGALGSSLDGDLDWNLILEVLGILAEEGPEQIVESTCILLGLYTTNEDGTPNTTFADDKAFLMGSVNFHIWVDMVRVFSEQNEYQRLARPFWERIRQAANNAMEQQEQTYMPLSEPSLESATEPPSTSSEPTPEPSSPVT